MLASSLVFTSRYSVVLNHSAMVKRIRKGGMDGTKGYGGGAVDRTRLNTKTEKKKEKQARKKVGGEKGETESENDTHKTKLTTRKKKKHNQ